LLSLHELSYRTVLGGNALLHDFSYEFKPGILYLLKGSNGSGKTTLLKLMAGIEGADEGEVCWNQASITDDISSYQSEVGLIRPQFKSDGGREFVLDGDHPTTRELH
jgi:ABC-type transport system involved in cytochrome c biogenesis ATPase subunit